MITQSICDPLIPHVIEKGEVSRERILSIFRDFPWQEKLDLMGRARKEEIHFSPSLGFLDHEARKGVSISIVGDDSRGYVFYLFYEREKEITKLFGLRKETVKVVSDLLDRKIDDCIDVLELFRDGDFHSLERYFSS